MDWEAGLRFNEEQAKTLNKQKNRMNDYDDGETTLVLFHDSWTNPTALFRRGTNPTTLKKKAEEN
eukprot:scaffold8114_cov126-Cylindrotheca_fusiformis.AAC.6